MYFPRQIYDIPQNAFFIKWRKLLPTLKSIHSTIMKIKIETLQLSECKVWISLVITKERIMITKNLD